MNHLKKLSDGNLIDQLKTLRKKEKATTLDIGGCFRAGYDRS